MDKFIESVKNPHIAFDGGTPSHPNAVGYNLATDSYVYMEHISHYSIDLNRAIEFAKFVINKLDEKAKFLSGYYELRSNTESSVCFFARLGRKYPQVLKTEIALAIVIAGLLTLEKLEGG